VKPSHTIRPTFDDPNVVSDAGVVPALRLGESAGLYDLLEEALTVDSPNATAKTTCVVGGMLADADSIDDLELLRHGGMGRLFGGVRPRRWARSCGPSATGTCSSSTLSAGGSWPSWPSKCRALVAGADASDGIAFIDVDDTIRQVHGYAKQAAAYGYSGVRGLNIQLATVSTPLRPPVIARAWPPAIRRSCCCCGR
jgi:hypothetical protein